MDQSLPAWDALADSFPAPSAGQAPALLPWLVAEWQLASFVRYFADLSTLIAQGLPWLMQRGSSAAVQRALTWVGFGAATLEEDGAYLHLALARSATADQVQRIAHVVRASIPAHVRFWRVYHGHDLRRLRPDSGPGLDAGLLDNDSGVWVPVPSADPVKASFGEHHGPRTSSRAAQRPHTVQTHTRSAQLSYDDRLQLDAWRLDSHLLVDAFCGIGELLRGSTAAPRSRQPRRMDGRAHIQAAAWSAAPPSHTRTDRRAAALPAPWPARAAGAATGAASAGAPW